MISLTETGKAASVHRSALRPRRSADTFLIAPSPASVISRFKKGRLATSSGEGRPARSQVRVKEIGVLCLARIPNIKVARLPFLGRVRVGAAA